MVVFSKGLSLYRVNSEGASCTYSLRYRIPKHVQVLGFPSKVVRSLKNSDGLTAQQFVLFKRRIMEKVRMATDSRTLRR